MIFYPKNSNLNITRLPKFIKVFFYVRIQIKYKNNIYFDFKILQIMLKKINFFRNFFKNDFAYFVNLIYLIGQRDLLDFQYLA